MKIQPIDFSQSLEESNQSFEPVKPPAVKSRLKRLFEWQFPNVLRSSTVAAAAAEKVGVVEEPRLNKYGSGEFEPSSVCLAKMVQNFIEESNEKQPNAVRCSRNRCNCFNGNCNDSSEDELDEFNGFGDPNFPSSGEASEILKGLVLCASVCERNLLADAAKVVEKNKICKRKDGNFRKIISDGLLALGYDASICKSRWEKSPSFPAGEYEYIDVIVEGERLLIDIDFRSEFEIARSTKTYKTILQTLPYIFVGKSDRLQRIIGIVTEAAKQSLKKKGMHFPPWRKAEYVGAKWLSPYTRVSQQLLTPPPPAPATATATALTLTTDPSHETLSRPSEFNPNLKDEDEFELLDGVGDETLFVMSDGSGSEEEEKEAVKKEWKPPAIKPKKTSLTGGVKIVTGLASVMEEDKP